MSRLAPMFVVIASLITPVVAQETAVKKAHISYTSPASGPEMYANYCAACHAKDAKGNGPAAPALKSLPTDLTALAKQNHGQFPRDHVVGVLSGKTMMPAHGSIDMPIWGKVFWALSEGHQSEVQMRIHNVTEYLESLQVK